MQIVKLGLVDDHRLFRKGMCRLIESVGNQYKIILEADNGDDLIKQLDKSNEPDIVLMDINMPGKDGFATVEWINENYPMIKVLVVSMVEKEESILKMLKLGVKGYLSKDVEPRELSEALDAVLKKGFYYTDFITGKLIHSLQQSQSGKPIINESIAQLNNREREFLQYACSEMTYKDIADKMFLSAKTIDGYRDALFEKLKVKSRVGLVIYAIRNELVRL